MKQVLVINQEQWMIAYCWNHKHLESAEKFQETDKKTIQNLNKSTAQDVKLIAEQQFYW